jgi:predicted MPP superfamily phosphohydrolase
MKTLLLQFGSALLYALAGFGVFGMLLNRYLILMPDSRPKTPLMLLAFALLVGGSGLAGFFAWRPPWIFIPAAVLLLMLGGEVRRLVIRRACAASPPLASIPHQVALANPITTTDLMVHRYEIVHPKWDGKPLRIVQLTDLHVHRSLPLDYYQNALKIAEEAQPDLAVFVGDFITKRSELPQLKRVLRPVAGAANLAILGNHDYWANPEIVRAAIKEGGLRLLSNETITLDIADSKVAVTGYDYPWGTKEACLLSGQNGMLQLVLSHTPDNIYRIAASRGDVVFAGHYHAGQVRMPLLGSLIIPSIYGRRFDHGHFLVNGTHLFVASGVGAVTPPVRVYCQPDIFIVDILPGKKERTGREAPTPSLSG